MCIFQIFYKSFSNVLQTYKLIHSFAAIAINHYNRNTKGERDFNIIKIFGHCIYAKYILIDASRSCQIF